MSRILCGFMLAIIAGLLLSGCAQLGRPGEATGRWIRFDAATQRYSIDAQQVPRGALLDELSSIAGVGVRPQPEREAVVTARAEELDLDGLVALLLPPGTRATVRPGEREIAGAVSEPTKPKQGTPLRPVAGAVAKPDAQLKIAPEIKRTGTLKAAVEAPEPPRDASGRNAKPQAAGLVLTSESTGPKKPLATSVPRATVRLQFLFEEGAPPRLIDARSVEGRAPAQRFVTGTYLFVVTAADGRILEAGTFQDPLIEHSYLPEGQHSTGRARSGVAGFSVSRDKLAGAVLRIVDITGVPPSRALDERVVRAALERGKPVLQLETSTVLRRLDQEAK